MAGADAGALRPDSRASNLTVFYHLSRALLVKKEADYDTFDRAFATYFRDVSEVFEVNDELLAWLENPEMPRDLTDEEKKALKELGFEDLLATFEKRLEEQKERHDGGNRWVGTGGTSPFGHDGEHPEGIRVGAGGGGRTAVQIAESRRFRNLRHDRILDTRQIGVALRRLTRAREGRGSRRARSGQDHRPGGAQRRRHRAHLRAAAGRTASRCCC